MKEMKIKERQIVLEALKACCAALAVIGSDLEHGRVPTAAHLEQVQDAILRMENAQTVLELTSSLF